MGRQAAGTRAGNVAAAAAGYVISNEMAYILAKESGETPKWTYIPCRAAQRAIEKFGYGSAEHLADAAIADQAMDWYLRGLAWPDFMYWPSPQERVATRLEDIIGIGGAKGGGKSFLLSLFMAQGNYHADPDSTNPVDRSYIHHPDYLGLILRQNQIDMLQLIDKSAAMYEGLGGVWIKDELRFVFPSGANVCFGHFKDTQSYQKYFGRNITRIGIDEAIQMERELFLQIRSCLRSSDAAMKAQALLGFNPIGGPGVQFIFDYFIEPKYMGAGGHMIPILGGDGLPMAAFDHSWTPVYPEKTIHEPVDLEIYEFMGMAVPEKSSYTRVFIPSTLADNPHLLHNDDYVRNLATMDPEDRDALLKGRWDQTGGAYFSLFRPWRRENEAENACHVLQVGELPKGGISKGTRRSAPAPSERGYWWPRAMAGDWGHEHESAIYSGEKTDQGQLNVYRERIFSNTLPETGGALIAADAYEDLARFKMSRMACYMGEDIEASRSGKGRSILELLAKGAATVLGPKAVHIPDFMIARLEDEAVAKGGEVAEETVRQVRQLANSGLVFQRAINDRIIGWQTLRSLFRWAPIMLDDRTLSQLNAGDMLTTLVMQGAKRFEERTRDILKAKVEVLPGIQIFSTCERLIEAIPIARKDEKRKEDVDRKHFRGMDSMDAIRYLVMAFSMVGQASEPISVEWARRRAKLMAIPGMEGTTSGYIHERKLEQEIKIRKDIPVQILGKKFVIGGRIRDTVKRLMDRKF